MLLLALVAAAALTPIYIVSSQDVSRLCLTRSLLAARLTIGSCAGHTFDRASFDGRTYSDKAPGESAIAIPAVAVTSLPAASRWPATRDARLWAIRLLTGGVGFVLLVAAFGRVAEGLAPGRGGLAIVALGLGTLVGAMAATTFGHVTAGALGFAAFLAAWRRRWVVAGLLSGCAVLVEYEAAIIAVVLAAYVASRGLKPLAAYVGATVPAAAVLAAYDLAAFGSPLHLSYRYVSNRFAHEQASGLFGVGMPHWHSVAQVLIRDRGLFITSPVMVAALVGLALLWRRHRAEAAVCAAVALGFFLLEFGYFLPYGGTSPGPRFLIPALPFLAIGVAPALARFPRTVILLTGASLVAGITVELTWSLSDTHDLHDSVWAELLAAADGSSHHLRHTLTSNAFSFLGVSTLGGAGLVAITAALAFAVAIARPAPHRREQEPRLRLREDAAEVPWIRIGRR